MYLIGELVRTDIIHGLSVHTFGQACVRLHQDGNGRDRQKRIHYAAELFRSDRTVRADCIRTHALRKCRHCLGRRARHKLSVLAVGIRNKHRQAAVFFRRKQSRLCFIAVIHRLYKNKLRTELNAEPNRLGKAFNRVLKIKIAIGFKQPPCRSDVKRNILRLFADRDRSCRIGVIERRGHNLSEPLAAEFKAVCAECIGVYYITAGIKIRLVYFLNYLGMRNVPVLGQLARFYTLTVQHCSETAVKIKYVIFHIIQNINLPHGYHPCIIYTPRFSSALCLNAQSVF